jgi:hypothetical protein
VSLVRQNDLENSERGEELNMTERKTHMSGGYAECVKKRYVRVAASIIVTIDGSRNNCV